MATQNGTIWNVFSQFQFELVGQCLAELSFLHNEMSLHKYCLLQIKNSNGKSYKYKERRQRKFFLALNKVLEKKNYFLSFLKNEF